ncbi:methyl-accepting chemotaxis protein [Thiomicrorhabdus indica]|uniref:methyl-accepting chemotaxis protein n=1 Tax=Thiomicrorhabdus indica TaxID=2267253 RepID=UPI00102E0E37|nr:methyl-accepting chemotaxis protein [Thiomicrorhabdus indica]
MSAIFVSALSINTLFSFGLTLFLLNQAEPNWIWLIIPVMIFATWLSLSFFYRKLAEQQERFCQQLISGQEVKEPLGLSPLLEAFVNKPDASEVLQDFISKLSSGSCSVDIQQWQGVSEEVVKQAEHYLTQNSRANEVMTEVIESVKSADFGTQLSLKRAQNELDKAHDLMETIRQEVVKLKQQGASRQAVIDLMDAHLKKHPEFETIWCGWEPNAYDGRDDQYRSKSGCDKDGRFLPICIFSETQPVVELLVDYEVPGLGDFYLLPKNNKTPQIIEPYVYSVGGEELLLTTYSMPILDNGEVIGVVGVDISLMSKLQSLSEDLPPQATKTVEKSVQAMLTLKGALAEVSRVLFYMSNGEFGNHRIERDLPGDLNGFKDMVNQSISDLQVAFEEINLTMHAFSNGDLTQTIQGDYQGDLHTLKLDINQAVNNLHVIISQAAVTSSEVVESIQTMEKDNQTLNGRTQQQAASIEETAASMEELMQTIRNTAEESTVATQLGEKTKNHVERGSEIVDQTLSAMNQISEASQKIADIVQLIESIAFQTNLLALNASVESARAGEHGRGFAVVAGEVRALAQRSAEASNQIKQLVGQNLSMVEQGQKLTDESANSFHEINQNIMQLVNIVTQISAAASQEMNSVEQVNQAISQLDQFTQENAALSDQTAQLSHSMTERANELSSAISSIRL